MSQPTQKLRLSALIALVVGSMIGGGIFSGAGWAAYGLYSGLLSL